MTNRESVTTKELVIISGVSGSGKSTALKAFEDSGYHCIDNLPAPLISNLVELLIDGKSKSEHTLAQFENIASPQEKYALLVDCRGKGEFAVIKEAVEKLRAMSISVSLLFFDCQDEVVIRRFRETRRPHPLLVRGSLVKTIGEALVRERELLAAFREEADVVIDTSAYSVHDLREVVERYCGSEASLELFITSFGFKYGAPIEADLLLDVRFLKNPHFDAELRPLTGTDKAVVEYVWEDDGAEETVKRYVELLEFLVPRYEQEGKRYLTVGIGCTGGRHRSVALAEEIAKRLANAGLQTEVIHRDITRANK